MSIKIAACVVLYNPDNSVRKNILSYTRMVDKILVADNSTNKSEVIDEIKQIEKVEYLDMRGNKGIACALNRGFEALIEEGYEYVMTMDQDSSIAFSDYAALYRLIDHYSTRYSVFCLNHRELNNLNKNKKIITVRDYITSGNIVNVKAFKAVKGFNEKLFIDYVDYEFDWKLYQKNYKIGVLTGFSINHRIGSPIVINAFGHRIISMNHAPFRYYYRYRNCYYLYHLDKSFFGRHWYEERKNLLKMLMFEKDSGEKLKMALKGIRDARKKLNSQKSAQI